MRFCFKIVEMKTENVWKHGQEGNLTLKLEFLMKIFKVLNMAKLKFHIIFKQK